MQMSTNQVDKSLTTTFVLDPRTVTVFEDLEAAFGVKTKAAVLRKALALACIAVRNSDKKTHTVTIGGGAKKETVSLVA
jgi:hypothetical protein